MFPLRDENPTELIPFITLALILLNVGVWLTLQSGGVGLSFVGSLCDYGTIPGELTGAVPAGNEVELGDYRCVTGGRTWSTLLTSIFMHGGWGHLIGNMWFLWVFGNNVEDSMGHGRFLVFYLLAGIAASATHVLTGPSSVIPTVGASGAISGVMGAYMVLYPRVRILTLVFVYLTYVPAWVMLGYWFVIQFLSGSASGAGAGIAFWAHVGGFVAGVILVKPFERRRLVEAKLEGRKLSREELRGIRW
jgi:membrane associated rhomboid family serine protease